MLQRKRATVRAPQLSARAMRVLEEGAERAATVEDRVFTGFCAFLAHNRTRFKDGARISLEPRVEGLYVEVEARPDQWKTGKRHRRKGRADPSCGPCGRHLG